MDYELKYVIAICLIVKIAALSPEIPIGEETENPEQSPSRLEGPPLLLAERRADSAGRAIRGRIFDRGPGGGKLEKLDTNDVAKVNENQSFDTCEHKFELLESSLNWRDIRKTLRSRKITHLSPNKAPEPFPVGPCVSSESIGLCKQNTSPESLADWLDRILASNNTELCHRRKRNHTRLSSKWKLKKKNSTGKSSIRRKQKFKKDGKHKHRSKGGKKVKRIRKNFRKNYLNATILKPNSVLHDVEKMFFQRTKSPQFWNSVIGNCEGLKCRDKKTKNTGHLTNETKMPKQKPWPHFVYHRVSSNFLHPDSPNQNHKQSAYIAISVVTSSKPDSTENTENV